MDRCDLHAVLDQLGHHRIDFGLKQHEVAHHHGPAMRRLERNPAAQCERRSDGYPVERHVQVAARKPVAMNVAANRGRRSSDRLVDLLPVYLLGAGTADGRHCANRKHCNSTHVMSS